MTHKNNKIARRAAAIEKLSVYLIAIWFIFIAGVALYGSKSWDMWLGSFILLVLVSIIGIFIVRSIYRTIMWLCFDLDYAALKNTSIKVEKSKSINKIYFILLCVVATISYFIGKSNFAGAVGIVTLAAIFVLGYYFSIWYMKRRSKIKLTFVKLLAWTNLITWTFPLLGIFTSLFTIMCCKAAPELDNGYRMLGNLGMIFSLTNFLFIIIRLSQA